MELQKQQGRTNEPRVNVRTVELRGAVLVNNPEPGFVIDQTGRAAWRFPDGSKLHVKNFRLYC